ncbi:HAD-IA family hydrolase [Martelella limonii]|uniref:HAD-IA family hydrolase n=1 Tax=Martelella limonii TaxID=1647649 RepID=UPI00158124E0|nr:HAD-IA family hydrolase [Martelella limonii]
MRLVLFDCDGTLVDTIAIIQESMARTFSHFGYPVPAIEKTRATVGLTLDICIAQLLGREESDDECREMMRYYKSLFAEVRAVPGLEEKLYEGIAQMLEKLFLQDDLLIGAVTGKSRRGLDHMLDLHGYTKNFIVSRTADECPSKPHPAMVLECCRYTGIDPADAVVIGDSVYDMQMARNAGAEAIGVSWGYGMTAELAAAGASAIAESPENILKLVVKNAQ